MMVRSICHMIFESSKRDIVNKNLLPLKYHHTEDCFVTDESIITLSVSRGIIETKKIINLSSILMNRAC